MKTIKTFFTAFLLCFITNSKAQPTLDTILIPQVGIGYDFFPVQISENETKYFFADTTTNTFSLYNMDFTPFITGIAVPQPFSNFDLQVMYISRALFDCDTTNIEYAYGGTTTLYEPYRIMRTDGTILLQVDSAYGPFCIGGCQGLSDYIRPIRNTSDGAKLYLYKQTDPAQIYVYSLCGKLETSGFEFPQRNESFVKIFPNPTARTLTFQITTPDNMSNYQVSIFDNTGKEVLTQTMNAQTNTFSLNVESLSSGAYFYALKTKQKTYQSGKFIVTK